MDVTKTLFAPTLTDLILAPVKLGTLAMELTVKVNKYIAHILVFFFK